MNFEPLQNILQEATVQGIIPGGAVVVWQKNQQLASLFAGKLEITPNERYVSENAIWDIASVTKVLGATPIILFMVSKGMIELDDPIQKYIPTATPGPTIKNCLQHCSGHLNWKPYFKISQFVQKSLWGSPKFRQDMLQCVVSEKLQHVPNEAHVYSDLGFMSLCSVIETIFSQRIDQVWEEILPSQAKQNLMWNPKAQSCFASIQDRIAATEMCLLRMKTIVGEVHDLNAYMLDGYSGHAGLFGSAQDVAAAGNWFLQLYHHGSVDVSKELVHRFFRDKGVGSHALGWDTPSGELTTASHLWPKNGVGHLGFTGCSLWIAPDEEVVVAFCSNFVHPIIEGGAMPSATPLASRKQLAQLRRDIHATAWTCLFG